MLNPQSELLLRNIDAFQGKKLLLVNCPADALVQELKEVAAEVHVLTENYQVYQALSPRMKDACQFAAYYQGDAQFDAAVIFYPKAKALADFLLANISQAVTTEGLLFMVGENKGGIKSAAKRLKGFDIFAQKLDSARHCSLLCWTNKPMSFDLDQYYLNYQYKDVHVKSLPGVFSQNQLDEGTRLLLEHLPNKISGHVLDFACGAGIIGASIKRANPDIELKMLDVSDLALTSTKATLAANQLEAEVFASNGLRDVSQRFHWIVTNPPFHTGLDTDYSITEGFIKDCKQHLVQGSGKLLLVANSFLRYEALLNSHFRQVETLAKTNKFVVYLAN